MVSQQRIPGSRAPGAARPFRARDAGSRRPVVAQTGTVTSAFDMTGALATPSGAESSESAASDVTGPAIKYQPTLDGLRGIGTFSVLFAHLAQVQPVLTRLGCYMFVDMFFVMSGFLITSSLVRERSTSGRVALKGFYVRRFARVYPLIALVLVLASLQRILWPQSSTTLSWMGIAGIAGYFANFTQISNHGDALSAWAPLWSLSIEEQYYALWPLLLLLLAGAVGRLRRPLLVLIVLTVAMWLWRSWSFHSATSGATDQAMAFENSTHAWRVFYNSTFHRPDGILIGSALALILARPATRLAKALARTAHLMRWPVIVGLAALVYKTASHGAAWQVYYGLAMFNVLMALLVVELLYQPDSHISRVLSFRPLTWVGRRCYFIYVMHVAIFMFVLNQLHWTTLPKLSLTVGVVFLLAGLSYRYYETPIRRWGYRTSARLTRGGHRPGDAAPNTA